MSVATPFNYYRPFPFCPGALAGTENILADNVSLADAMDLFWLLENLSFSFGCSTAGGTRSGSIELDPLTSTGALSGIYGSAYEFFDSSMFAGTTDTPASIRQPSERVCWYSSNTDNMIVGFECIGTPGFFWCHLQIRDSTDYPGQYAIFGKLALEYVEDLGGGEEISMQFTADGPGPGFSEITLSIGDGLSFSVWGKSQAVLYDSGIDDYVVTPGTVSASATATFFTFA